MGTCQINNSTATTATLLVMIALVSLVVRGERSLEERTAPCTPYTACYPSSSKGPFCGRSAKINLRFYLQKTNGSSTADDEEQPAATTGNVTYAFCPLVDQIQAFNLTRPGEVSYTYVDNESTVHFMGERSRYLALFGAGDLRNVDFPQPGSAGRVMVADKDAVRLDGHTPQCDRTTQIAVVSFLLFNMTMDKGRFVWYQGYSQSTGVGFLPTCDSSDTCLFDAAAPCIGEPGQRNCATCMTAEAARKATLQVWMSYYGTDASGRSFTSGRLNPINYQVFGGGGVIKAMRDDYARVSSGRGGDPDGLEP